MNEQRQCLRMLVTINNTSRSHQTKFGLYRLFKDIHQSNLDDIEDQHLEEKFIYMI